MARIKTLEASVYQEENAYRTELAIQKRQNQCLLGTALDPPSRIEAVRKRDALDSIEKSRPVRVPYVPIL